MISRSLTRVAALATLGCGIAASCGSADAQYYYPGQYPDRNQQQYRQYPDRPPQYSYPGKYQNNYGDPNRNRDDYRSRYQYDYYPTRQYYYPDTGPRMLPESPYMHASPVPRTMVTFPTRYRPGEIVIDTAARRLYLVTSPGEALSYGIGVGRDGFAWSGVRTVTAKREWPDWTPPAQMLARRPDLPRHMEGGIENPLGARALYLGSTLYRIHGSNEPETIGLAVSSGCFRLTNEDVIDLYERVHVGAKVTVLQ